MMWFKGHRGDVVLGPNSALFDLRSSPLLSWMSICKRRGVGFRAHRALLGLGCLGISLFYQQLPSSPGPA